MKALSVKPEILLEDGQEVAFGKARLKVIHTPGHTPGSLCFLVGKHLLSGDTLFPHGPGRTNTPADLTRIIGSITGRLFVLSDDTEVYPGHGNSTILAKEKEEFAVFSARSHDPGLSGDVLWLSS
jgi:glyoxylase-like metal-dependent hydrolase (beta-lactamase superfamily II)